MNGSRVGAAQSVGPRDTAVEGGAARVGDKARARGAQFHVHGFETRVSDAVGCAASAESARRAQPMHEWSLHGSLAMVIFEAMSISSGATQVRYSFIRDYV